MPQTRRGAATEIEKSASSASEDNGSPPPAPVGRRSNRKAQAATPIASKSNKPSTTSRATSEAGGKQNQTGKRNQASRDADAQPQPSTPVERSTEPSENPHAADEADKSAGAANPPANHAEREGRQPS